MSVVYLAEDLRLEQRVALKLLAARLGEILEYAAPGYCPDSVACPRGGDHERPT
jgi:hypothetical protein